jgi:hypothetical protein
MFGPPIRSGVEPLRLRAAALAADHFTRILRVRARVRERPGEVLKAGRRRAEQSRYNRKAKAFAVVFFGVKCFMC